MTKTGASIRPQIEACKVAFVGRSIDNRGDAAIDLVQTSASQIYVLEYKPDTLDLWINDQKILVDYFCDSLPEFDDRPVLIEATTLGLPELYLVLKALQQKSVRSVKIIYVEPKEYKRNSFDPESTSNFELSESILGYLPIPGAVIDLNNRNLKRGVFFLGYEGERLERAFEDQQMIRSEDVSVVFGVPAYQVGWEMDSIFNNLETIKERNLGHDIRYCPADNPSAAFDELVNVLNGLDDTEQMFIAPLGTKPCGIGAALFAVKYNDRVGLIYDHPRRKSDRTKEINAWHTFNISLDS